MGCVGGDIFRYESTADGVCREDGEVAIEAAPFGEVVRYVEGGWGGDGIFIIYEGYVFDLRTRGMWYSGMREKDHVAAEEVGVTKDELCTTVNGGGWWR